MHAADGRAPRGAPPWRILRLRQGEELYRCGAAVGNVLYLVRFGAFKTRRAGADGRARIVGFQMNNDLLGLETMGLPRQRFDAVALQDSEVYEIPFAALPPARLHALLSDASAQAGNVTLMLRCTGAEQRLAAFLLNMSCRFAAAGYSPHTFRLQMSRSEIAEYLGLSAESISRCLSRLRAEGLIRSERRLLTLLDREALLGVAGGERAVTDYIAGPRRLGDSVRIEPERLRGSGRRRRAPVSCMDCPLRRRPPEAPERRGRVDLGPMAERRLLLSQGEHLYRMDQPVGGKLYLIKSGLFKIYQLTTHGRQHVAYFRAEGDVLGLNSIGAPTQRCSAIALTDSVLCEFSCGGHAQARWPGTEAATLDRLLVAALGREHWATLLIREGSARQRLAKFLLCQGRRHGAGQALLLNMTRQDIGDYLDLMPETVSRLLHQFGRAGVVEVLPGALRIIDLDAMRGIADGAASI